MKRVCCLDEHFKSSFVQNRINGLDRRIKEFSRDKQDVEKDLSGPNGLRELNYQFSKQKKEIELLIYRLSRDCEQYHQSLTEIEEEQKRLKKHMVTMIPSNLKYTIHG